MKDLKERAKAAIRRAARLGNILRTDLPQIVDMYRTGTTQYGIVDSLGLKLKYKVTSDVARTAVKFYLTGYRGPPPEGAYDGVLEEDEAESIAKDHLLNAAYRTGTATLEAGIGIHARDFEKRSKDSRNTVVSRGEIPWFRVGEQIEEGIYCTTDELARAYELSEMKEFRTLTGRRVRNTLIARELNEKYHGGMEVRNKNTVHCALQRYRKSLELKVDN